MNANGEFAWGDSVLATGKDATITFSGFLEEDYDEGQLLTHRSVPGWYFVRHLKDGRPIRVWARYLPVPFKRNARRYGR